MAQIKIESGYRKGKSNRRILACDGWDFVGDNQFIAFFSRKQNPVGAFPAYTDRVLLLLPVGDVDVVERVGD